MRLSRRNFGLGLGALTLAACGGAPVVRSSANLGGPMPADLLPTPNASYDAWVANFRGRAAGQGISQATLASAFRGTGYLPGCVKRDRNQTEFSRSLEDYLALAASDERISKGRAAFARTSPRRSPKKLSSPQIAQMISATSTLAFDGRRGAFFEKQLIAALKIVQNGDIPASRMTGSWAGAMGHTQFIPTSYQAFAVDFTGDGRRDIWSEDPTDALASTAAYLQRNGWSRGTKWGGEVGNGAPEGSIIQPQAGGPRFAVTRNFRAIKRYNNSDAYAIGVGHLADRIGGAGPLRGSFPPDANGLTKDDRVALQQRLTARGFDTGGTDGVIGPNSEKAISAYQGSKGLSVTGKPSPELLRQLL